MASACLLLGCRTPPIALVTVEQRPVAGGVELTLSPAPGARINARLKPALERPDGTVEQFDSPHLTQDSSYFASAPALSTRSPVDGVVRASVCPEGKAVCVPVTIEVKSPG